jgi:hypothetical protein
LGGYDERLDKKLRNGLWDDHAAIQAIAEHRPIRIVKKPSGLMSVIQSRFVFLIWMIACMISLLSGHTDAALVFGFLAAFAVST